MFKVVSFNQLKFNALKNSYFELFLNDLMAPIEIN